MQLLSHMDVIDNPSDYTKDLVRWAKYIQLTGYYEYIYYARRPTPTPSLESPPRYLWHGTWKGNLASIKADGLIPQNGLIKGGGSYIRENTRGLVFLDNCVKIALAVGNAAAASNGYSIDKQEDFVALIRVDTNYIQRLMKSNKTRDFNCLCKASEWVTDVIIPPCALEIMSPSQVLLI